MELRRAKGVNPSGEGGEYESMVLDSPLHLSSMEVIEAERQIARDQGRLAIKRIILREKT